MRKSQTVFLGKYIKQPNRVSEAIFYDCTLIMHKIFNALTSILGKYVEQSYNKIDVAQMDLFEIESDLIKIELPYNAIINDPTHYDEVDDALIKLCKKVIEIPYADESGTGWRRITKLFTVTIPDRHNNNIFLEIEKSIAKLLIFIDPTKGYTKFLFDIPYLATTKYTPPMYKLLAGWRQKGRLKISKSELYKLLSIKEGSYTRYCDFKRKVLKPVQKDLQNNNSDFWFDCDRKDFSYRNGKEHMFCFTLISKTTIEKDQTKINYITNTLRTTGLNENQIKSIEHIIYDDNISKEKILFEISRIDNHIFEKHQQSSDKKINDRASYMTKSLINFGKTQV